MGGGRQGTTDARARRLFRVVFMVTGRVKDGNLGAGSGYSVGFRHDGSECGCRYVATGRTRPETIKYQPRQTFSLAHFIETIAGPCSTPEPFS
jgi:hypothetical protein